MNRKQILGFLVAMIGMFACLQAQPGYLGKRNIIQYDLFAMPAGLFGGGIGFNQSHAVTYHRVTSRKTVVGMGATYLPLPKFQAEEFNGGYVIGDVKSRSVGLMFQAKFYPFLRKGWLAPLGPFVRVAVNVNRQVATWTASNGTTQHPWETHFWAGYQLETGYSTVLLGHVQMDLGFRFCLSEFLNYFSDASSAKRYNLAYDILESELFKIHIGLGYLL